MAQSRWIRQGLMIVALALLPTAPLAQSVTTGGASGLPVPRFVSLKSDSVNVRRGPSRDQTIVWRYVRAGLPVEITQEYENWRRIRDFQGGEGWVFHSLLSGARTALVAPWENDKKPFDLRAGASDDSRVTAMVEPGVQAQVSGCDGAWCLIKSDGFSGYIHQQWLWGVYPNEKF